jgi:hypothetical protein
MLARTNWELPCCYVPPPILARPSAQAYQFFRERYMVLRRWNQRHNTYGSAVFFIKNAAELAIDVSGRKNCIPEEETLET